MKLEDLEKNPEKTFEYIKKRLARRGRYPEMKIVYRDFEVKDSGNHKYIGNTYIQIGKNIFLRWIVGRIERPIFYQVGSSILIHNFQSLKFIIFDLANLDCDWRTYVEAEGHTLLYIKAGLHHNVDKLRASMEKDLAKNLAWTEKYMETIKRRFNKVFGHLESAKQPSTTPSDFACSSSHVFQNTQQIVGQLADKLNTLKPQVTLRPGNIFARIECPEIDLFEIATNSQYLWLVVTHNNVSVPFGLFVDSHYKKLFIVPACLAEGNVQRDGNRSYQRYHIKSAVFTDER